MTPQQRIIAILRTQYVNATVEHKKAHAERVGVDAAANAWDRYRSNNDIEGLSQNPHNTHLAIEKEETTKLYASQIQKAYELAIDTFITPELAMPYLVGKDDKGIIIIDNRQNTPLLHGPVELESQIRDLVQAANERIYETSPRPMSTPPSSLK